jgi:hypothetical protein
MSMHDEFAVRFFPVLTVHAEDLTYTNELRLLKLNQIYFRRKQAGNLGLRVGGHLMKAT